MITQRFAASHQLHPLTLFGIAQLRVDVFVVEQKCPYPEFDDRDSEPGTLHVWLEDNGRVVGYLRLLEEANGDRRIGRVVVAKSHRGQDLGARLMRAGIARAGDSSTIHLDSQTYAKDFYARFGFSVSGEEFLEDGIAHLPMRRH